MLSQLLSFGRFDDSTLTLILFGKEYSVNLLYGSVTLLTLYVASRVLKLSRGLQAVSHLPGLRIPFQPLATPGVLFPTTWWNPGIMFTWVYRYNLYKKFQSESVSVVPFIAGAPVIYTSNLDVARQVSAGGHKSSFIKPLAASRILLLWGMNLIASDGDTWRRHRRVVGPAFGNSLYQTVWKESLETYKEMLTAESWTGQKSVDIPVVQKLTFKFALLIIGKCGFGFPFNWSTPPKAPDGTMSVQEALRVMADTGVFAVVLPKWVQKLPFPRLKEMRTAHSQLLNFMRAQVAERKADIRSQDTDIRSTAGAKRLAASDVFTMLVEANEDEAGKFQLDDQELIGNVFIMLFAGHETTAQTLAATLAFLSLETELQEEIYQQIIDVVGKTRDPELDDSPKLEKVTAAFFEALRMFPTAYVMIREATEDTVLNIPNPEGQEGSTTLPVLKGAQVVVDMIGVQNNPRYFDEPEKYKPSRWYGMQSESELFSAFSIGTRACIGRKFAITESICFLTMLLRDWRVEPMLRSGETKEAWKERVLAPNIVITLGITDVPVRLIRR